MPLPPLPLLSRACNLLRSLANELPVSVGRCGMAQVSVNPTYLGLTFDPQFESRKKGFASVNPVSALRLSVCLPCRTSHEPCISVGFPRSQRVSCANMIRQSLRGKFAQHLNFIFLVPSSHRIGYLRPLSMRSFAISSSRPQKVLSTQSESVDNIM